MTVRKPLTTLWALLTLPPALAHEVVHAALAAPWADELAIVIDPAGADAACGIDWQEGGAPQWAIVLAAYGPAIVGGVVGLLGAVQLALGGVPSSAHGQLTLGVLGVWWVIFTAPSGRDRNATEDSP